MRDRHRVELHRSSVAGVEAMTLATAHAFPRHSHDQYGVGVIDRGGQRSWSGVGPVEAGPGDVIMVNPGEVHDGVPHHTPARAWRMVYLDPALTTCEADDVAGGAPARVELRPVARDEVLAHRFSRLFEVATAFPDPLARDEALLALVACLVRRQGVATNPAPVPAGPTPPVALARSLIDDDPAAPVTLAELAVVAGVSRFQVLRAFSRELGLTPRAYVLQRRLSLARRLIADGGRLADTAVAAGFADQSHMTRTFVSHLGVTPGRYAAALA